MKNHFEDTLDRTSSPFSLKSNLKYRDLTKIYSVEGIEEEKDRI